MKAIFMKAIFQRTGRNVKAGRAKFRVPAKESVLAISGNEIFDGDDFREDGYVYSVGKARRKWFITVGGRRVWSPKTNDLFAAEAKRWRFVQIRKKKYQELWSPMFQRLAKAHRFTTRAFFGGSKKGDIVFDCDQYGIGWRWLDHWKESNPGKNAPKRNNKLGKLYFDVERRCKRYGKHAYDWQQLFLRAVANRYTKTLYDRKHAGEAPILHLVFDDRNYWFVAGRDGVEMLSAPEETITEVVLPI